jgi:hypothetical protein
LGSGFRVLGSGFRVLGSGFRVLGSGFRVQGSEVQRFWAQRFWVQRFKGSALQSKVADPIKKWTLLTERRALI